MDAFWVLTLIWLAAVALALMLRKVELAGLLRRDTDAVDFDRGENR